MIEINWRVGISVGKAHHQKMEDTNTIGQQFCNAPASNFQKTSSSPSSSQHGYAPKYTLNGGWESTVEERLPDDNGDKNVGEKNKKRSMVTDGKESGNKGKSDCEMR